jgi:anaerobic magnesium-protoporphyrin IX monomethyl ester cyclase
MPDILFVHPNASKKIYQELAENHSAIEPPIWAGMLANSVRSAGFSVAILDAEAERLDYESAAIRVTEYKSRIVCLVVYGQQPSASSQNMIGACATAAEIKKLMPNSFILFVGGHVAALPEETLKNEPDIDAVCQNEGVFTIRQLLSVTNLEDKQQLRKVLGLCFRDQDSRVTLNKSSEIVSKEHLEGVLPGVAWDLLPSFKKYRTAGWHSWSNGSEKEPFAALYTSLGCPYRCSFCMINIINRTDSSPGISSENSNVFRWWSPDFIIKQFDHFANEGVRNVKIADELFVLNPNHFIKICDLIIERGYDFNIWAYSRIDTCKPQYLDKLKRAGINWLGLGIENPSATLRKEIHKDGFADVKIVDVIKQISDSGINVGANYIFGLPNDTIDSMKATLEFAMSNMTEMTNMYCAMAYPGSPLYLQAKAFGLTLPTTYSGYSQHSYDTQNLATEKLTAAEILSFRDSAWHKYHENPSYLNLLEKKFGIAAKIDVVETTKIKLKRKLLGD